MSITIGIVIWFVGFIITSMMFAVDEKYKPEYMFASIAFGWVLGYLILAWYLSQLIPKLLDNPFRKSGRFFERFLK